VNAVTKRNADQRFVPIVEFFAIVRGTFLTSGTDKLFVSNSQRYFRLLFTCRDECKMAKHTTMKCGRSPQRRRGATAVEFAVVAPILFAFVLGFIALGQMVTVQQILTHAAREGCRKAALSTTMTKADVQNVARDFLRRGAIRSAIVDAVEVDVDPVPSTAIDSETAITVELDVDYADICWVPITFFGFLSDVKITGTCTMARE
jgi:Flp pilus assembly protein TadG